MNEQLVVKNFGPIKEATVDFKRVTVFIGPTGGGKSTLAKLAAIFREVKELGHAESNEKIFAQYGLANFKNENSKISWSLGELMMTITKWTLSFNDTLSKKMVDVSTTFINDSAKALKFELGDNMQDDAKQFSIELRNKLLKEIIGKASTLAMNNFLRKSTPQYILSERTFAASLEYSWPGLMRDDIGLPKVLLDFANSFSVSRKDVSELEVSFLNVKYLHINGRDFIKIPEREEPLMLLETASGIQSVTPLLVLLEHLSRNTEQAQSFIIEEPELNLYPTAQQGLLNWLVEKCTKGENDLTITTHSPYILSSCNLLLEAYKVAQQRPELADEIEKIVPRACWLNPDEFAAYYVADGTVRPITDERTHLIGGNELDSVSGDISDSFRRLLQLKKQMA